MFWRKKKIVTSDQKSKVLLKCIKQSASWSSKVVRGGGGMENYKWVSFSLMSLSIGQKKQLLAFAKCGSLITVTLNPFAWFYVKISVLTEHSCKNSFRMLSIVNWSHACLLGFYPTFTLNLTRLLFFKQLNKWQFLFHLDFSFIPFSCVLHNKSYIHDKTYIHNKSCILS